MTPVLTISGQQIDLAAPEPRTIKLRDIAFALSRLPRFGGHTSRFWSVADHSLLVAQLVGDADPDLTLAALLHDAHEAYVGDVISPLRAELFRRAPYSIPTAVQTLSAITADLDSAVARAFALDSDLLKHPAVKAADTLALAVEAKLLMDPIATTWPDLPALPDPMPPLPPSDQMKAQNHFIIRALELIQTRHGVRKALMLAAPIDETAPAP